MEERLKEVVNEIKPVLKAAGFKKKALNFFKQENGLVFLINIQKSHGNSHHEIGFYVNCCIHSNVIEEELGQKAKEFPKEYQCHFRKRIEKISESAPDKFVINAKTNMKAMKGQVKRSIEDTVNHFQAIKDNNSFVRHLSQHGTLMQSDVFRFCLRKNLVDEAAGLVGLIKENIDSERWEKTFKPHFSEIVEEEKSNIEIEALT